MIPSFLSRAKELSALDEAESRTPDDWKPYFLEAVLLAKTDPARARQAIERARQLNAVGADVIALSQSLGAS